MKQLFKFAAAAAMFASASFASAAVITQPLTETITPSTPFLVDSANPFTYTFDFTTPTYGYVTGSDTIGKAWLSILLNDDGGSETYKFLLNSLTFRDETNTPSSELYNKLAITGTPLTSLSANGKLTLTISASSGSFKLVSSTLDAEMTRTVADPVTVPEPLSVALIGLGLAGMTVARRKATRAK